MSPIRAIRISTLGVAFAATLLLSGAAAGAEADRRSIVPVGTYHQHLVGPTALANLLARRAGVLPVVTLPPELAALVAAREKASGTTAPNDVFTPDAVLLELTNGDRWVKGREAVQNMVSRYTADTHFLPVSYDAGEHSGYIAGVVRSGDSQIDEMNFLFVLEKGPAGWQIAAESTTNKPAADFTAPITADGLIQDMDETGIRRGVILSLGYTLARSPEPAPDEYAQVREENDWNVREAARFPGRLVVFCGVNPLRDYALEEIARCAKLPNVKGVKIHLANSRIDVDNPEHLARLRRVFRAANEHGLAIVAHLWVPGDYGRKEAKVFLDQLLPEAPDVVVQIAHLAGAGPGEGFDDALGVYAEAIARHDPRMRNVYFDITTVVLESTKPETAALVARRLREIGLERVLFGSDLIAGANPPPGAQWATLRRILPLTNEELKVLAGNIPPYMR